MSRSLALWPLWIPIIVKLSAWLLFTVVQQLSWVKWSTAMAKVEAATHSFLPRHSRSNSRVGLFDVLSVLTSPNIWISGKITKRMLIAVYCCLGDVYWIFTWNYQTTIKRNDIRFEAARCQTDAAVFQVILIILFFDIKANSGKRKACDYTFSHLKKKVMNKA